MLQLGLTGMAEAMEKQLDIADFDQFGFDDLLATRLEREYQHGDNRSYPGHLPLGSVGRPGRNLYPGTSQVPMER